MILGTGIDICAVGRLRHVVERHGDRFLSRIYTPGELAHCRGEGTRNQRLAARFAAKEATMKALGTGWARGVRFADIEVAHEPGGRPIIRLSGAAAEHARAMGVEAIHLSLSHEREYAIAFVVMEGRRG